MIKLKWIYLLGSAIQAGACISSLIKGDIILANTYLILSILFLNWYRDDVRKEETTSNTITRSYIDGKDLIITIEKDKK